MLQTPFHHATAGRRSVDRRVVLKAGALLAAIAAGRAISAVDSAHGASEVPAGTWSEGLDEPLEVADGWTTFATAFAFGAVAPHWSGGNPGGATVELQLSDGDIWSEVIRVGPAHADGGPPDRDGRTFGSLTFTAGARLVNYRALDASGSPTVLDGLAFTYLDASSGPGLNDILAASAAGIGGARPPIISRAAWGANEAYRYDRGGNLRWPQEYQPVEHVIIHHTETVNFADPVDAVRAIYYYHAVERGWGDLGYNYLVDHLGNIYEGRAGGEHVVGGHAYQYAYGSSGIGLLGSFTFESATVEAQAALVALTAWLTRDLDPYGWRPFHQSAGVPTICGHRDVDGTICPGDMLYDDLPAIRALVAGVQRAAGTLDGGAVGPGQVVRVLVPDGNLRSAAGLGARILRTLPLDAQLTVLAGPVSRDGFVWFEVADEEGSGWCASALFTVAPPDEPRDGIGFSTGDPVVVATDALNLRAGPGTSAGIVATLPAGASGTIISGARRAEGYAWYEIETAGGTGWGVGMYLARAPLGPGGGTAFSPGDRVEVATDFLNIRGRAGLGAWVVATLASGDIGTVRSGPARLDGYDWYELETGAGDGWAVGHYLTRSSAGPTGGGDLWIGDDVFVDTDALNLRRRPGGAVIATMPTGTRLTVTDGPTRQGGNDWYRVRGDQGEGWCAGTYLTRVPFTAGQRVGVVDGALNLRAEPDSASAVRAVLPDRSRLRIRSGPRLAGGVDWYRVSSVQYGAGWCAGRYLELI